VGGKAPLLILDSYDVAILLISTIGPPQPWLDELKRAFPDEEVRTAAAVGDPTEIDVAIVAQPNRALLGSLANVKLIVSLRAGVDDLLAVPGLSPDVPIVRAQDPGGDTMMEEYALLHVLRHHRDVPAFAAAQARGEWISLGVKVAADRSVGFMGLGVIGLPAARRVRKFGFRVAAWTRTPKDEPGIESFVGAAGLESFLRRSEIVVNLLAVTPGTAGVLNARTLAMLPKGASIINIGRGEHVDDAALIAALDSGHLAHATLDVFRTEPLPPDHPYWRHPKVTVMPHTARRPQAARIIPHAVENIRRFRAGRQLLQLVDRGRGY
jgi:glyoxylate/hydroxypyruvate reductase A